MTCCNICQESLYSDANQSRLRLATGGYATSKHRPLVTQSVTHGGCGHSYHTHCLKKWLYAPEGNGACPVCRNDWVFPKRGYQSLVKSRQTRIRDRHHHHTALEELVEENVSSRPFGISIEFPTLSSDSQCTGCQSTNQLRPTQDEDIYHCQACRDAFHEMNPDVLRYAPRIFASRDMHSEGEEEILTEAVNQILDGEWPPGTRTYDIETGSSSHPLLYSLTTREMRWIRKRKRHMYAHIGHTPPDRNTSKRHQTETRRHIKTLCRHTKHSLVRTSSRKGSTRK